MNNNMRRTLVVMAKAPVPGKVKTQLCPPLNPQSAARLHECFVRDALAKAGSVPDAELYVSYKPSSAVQFFKSAAPDANGFIAQRGGDTGKGVIDVFSQLCEHGRSVIAVGTDCPTLPARSFELAFDALSSDQVDIVFGPSGDGRCYLVGIKSVEATSLLDVAWEPGEFIEKSIERAADCGKGWYLLPEWYDVRTPTDLAHLKSELLDKWATNSAAPHTAAYLSALKHAGEI